MKNRWIVICMAALALVGTGILGLNVVKAAENDPRPGTIRVGEYIEAEFPGLAGIDSDQAVKAALKKVKGSPKGKTDL